MLSQKKLAFASSVQPPCLIFVKRSLGLYGTNFSKMSVDETSLSAAECARELHSLRLEGETTLSTTALDFALIRFQHSGTGRHTPNPVPTRRVAHSSVAKKQNCRTLRSGQPVTQLVRDIRSGIQLPYQAGVWDAW